jgi:16S rRNA (adenine1518-N6/adenine1519-N6)-dimethyltransferase
MDHPLKPEPLSIPGILKESGLTPNKGLGQNFLVDPHYLSMVAEAGELTSEDAVLEIGAGIGNLTRYLGCKAGRVVAVEIDQHLFPVLIDLTKQYENIDVVEGNILNFAIEDLVGSTDFVVVANIPYYITSKIIRHLMTSSTQPSRVILTIQEEVAQRICSTSGKNSLLSLSVQVYGRPSIVARIPAGAFYPVPKVESAIVKIDILAEPLIPARNLKIFFSLARAGFGQKRKNLRNSLSASAELDKKSTTELLQSTGIDPNRRAETLSLQEWSVITSTYLDIFPPLDNSTN